MLAGALATALLLGSCCLTVFGQADTPADLKSQIKQDIGFLKSNVFSFWQQHGLDSEFGGFHGTLDRTGSPVSSTEKGLVQQARHTWAFSTYHLHGNSSGFPSALQMAQSAYVFLVDHMRDPADGLWYNSVTREGKVADSRKLLYGHWFVLYSFSKHSTLNSTVKDLAMSTFAALDSAWHNNDTGGYNEGGSKRSLNILMHGTEALSALHRFSRDSNVLSRLLELLEIICTRLARSDGLVYEEYSAGSGGAQWNAAGGTINYGHNLESAWLVADTLDYLLSIDAITGSTACAYRAAAMAAGAAAVRDGYDRTHGGIYESNGSKAKVWWVQAEAMLGAWKLHQYYGDKAGGSAGGNSSDASGPPSYLKVLADTARFLKQHQTDGASGEQFWQVNADGSWGPTGDRNKDTKGNEWKASYHSSRAPLFLEQWIS